MQRLMGLVLGLVAATTAYAADWENIVPGGDTGCAYGSPYSFYVRRGSKDKALVFFQGGGACWSSQNCDLKNRPSFDPFVNETDDPGTVAKGIFDLANTGNPFRDWTMVFVAYCSGDVHLGNAVRHYSIRDEAGGYDTQITIRHWGYRNAISALDWLTAHYAPSQLFVAGSSAGAIAAPFYADILANEYPDADITVFSDASGAYRSGALTDLLKTWGARQVVASALDYPADILDDLTFNDLPVMAEEHHPKLRFAQYNAAFDESQAFFNSLLGDSGHTLDNIRSNQGSLSQRMKRVSSFVDNGKQHMVLEFDRFYEPRANGQRVVDYVNQLLAGEVPASVTCSPCTLASGGESHD